MVHTCKFDLLSGPYLSICLPLDLELKVVLKLTNSLNPYVSKPGSGGFKIDNIYLGVTSPMCNLYHILIGYQANQIYQISSIAYKCIIMKTENGGMRLAMKDGQE